MDSGNLAGLSDQELLKKLKNVKTYKLIDAVLIGVGIGAVIYSAIKNGFTFFTFFPLLFVFIITKSLTKHKISEKEIQRELNSRNLK